MEHETFWTLVKDLAHWEFELFLIVIFDIFLGALIWPRIKKMFSHHKEDDDKLESLEKRVRSLEQNQK